MNHFSINPRMPLLEAFFLACIIVGGVSVSYAQSMIPGDLLVSVYGDTNDSNLLDGNPTPITLEEFSLNGTTSATQDNAFVLTNIVGEYGSSSEGTIQLTGNGEYLTIGGYNPTEAEAGVGAPGSGIYEKPTTNPATANNVALAQSSSTNVARVADVIDANGNVVSATAFSDIYTSNNIRSVYSPNGTSVYVSGQGNKTGPEQGVFYSSVGTNWSASTPAQNIYTNNDTRTVSGYNGNIYYSVDKKITGIFEYSGNPTTPQATNGGTRITAANNGLTGTNLVNYSPEGFYFANTNTLYVSDTGDPKTGNNGDGGIQKWTTLNGVTWTLQYTLTPTNFISPINVTSATSGQTGFEAITGEVVGTNVDLYAVSYTADDAGFNGLYAITDALVSTNGAGETFTELEAASGTNGSTAVFNFKGVSFTPQAVPEPSTWALLGLSSVAGIVLIRRRKQNS
jgi:hypothetical protein